jgi:hypoxanthine phosphoribosyltransferase
MDKPFIVGKIILSEERIQETVNRLAGQINSFYQNESNVVVLTVLKGARRFSDDLRKTGLLPEDKYSFHDISAQSYRGRVSPTEKVDLTVDQQIRMKRRHVLIVDDIYDRGNTLATIVEKIDIHKPKSVNICVLLKKTMNHLRLLDVKFVGHKLDTSDFLIGYGLDYKERCRDYPYVATINKDFLLEQYDPSASDILKEELPEEDFLKWLEKVNQKETEREFQKWKKDPKTQDIICNMCGKSCYYHWLDFHEVAGLVNARILPTNLDDNGLGETTVYNFNICESCLSRLFKDFKIPPHSKTYDPYMFVNMCMKEKKF